MPLGKIGREEWLFESRFDGKAIIFRGSSSDDANARDFPRVVISDKAQRERPPVKVESQLRSGEGETVEWQRNFTERPSNRRHRGLNVEMNLQSAINRLPLEGD